MLLEIAEDKYASESYGGGITLRRGKRNIKNANTETFETNSPEGKDNTDTAVVGKDEQLQTTREKIHGTDMAIGELKREVAGGTIIFEAD